MIFPMLIFVFVIVMIFLVQGLRVALGVKTIAIETPFAELTFHMPSSEGMEGSLFGGDQIPQPNNGAPNDDVNNTKPRVYKRENASAEEYFEWSPRPYEPMPRPPEEAIVNGWNVTGDMQWLLNFAITGFPKCGTSTLMHYFATNPEVQIFADERCDLGGNQHVTLVRDMYRSFPAGDYVRGIKCPSNLENALALTSYQTWFPQTDMIVGVRHPIKWFESFYNHRMQNNFEMPSPKALIGSCSKKCNGVCTNRANFHVNLATLGMTNLSRAEMDLFPLFAHKWVGKPNAWSGRLFLYDVDQLNDKNKTRSARFRKDLQRFLYLRYDLPPMVWFKPGRKKLSEAEQAARDAQKIDICDDQHKPVRKQLLLHAKNASQWMRNHFMTGIVDAGAVGAAQRHVDASRQGKNQQGRQRLYISSPHYFDAILRDWVLDPCRDGGSYKKKAAAKMNCTQFGCFLAEKQRPMSR